MAAYTVFYGNMNCVYSSMYCVTKKCVLADLPLVETKALQGIDPTLAAGKESLKKTRNIIADLKNKSVLSPDSARAHSQIM